VTLEEGDHLELCKCLICCPDCLSLLYEFCTFVREDINSRWPPHVESFYGWKEQIWQTISANCDHKIFRKFVMQMPGLNFKFIGGSFAYGHFKEIKWFAWPMAKRFLCNFN